ncbi:uncharacterized protein [Venturia canescens]|nr:uncharacterized protein LOC122419186 isoform X2 [Venturia canescens]XP_043289442.1 uncharacterized protein LOC122419186 isoform X2 [Venturia canescens]
MESSEIGESREMWETVWHTFANLSLTYDLVSSQNVTKESSEGSNFLFENPAKLGVLTGLLIACLADFRIATSKFQLDVSPDSKWKSTLTTLLHLAIFLLLLPIITPILSIFFVYRKVVESLLRRCLKSGFAGLLEGTDCVWALEESTALSVINVLGVFERNDSTTEEDFLRGLRKTLAERLRSSNFEKLHWLRAQKYGYYYWEKGEKARIEELVRWMDGAGEHEDCDGSCTRLDSPYFEKLLAESTNKQLPRGHKACWEILVGRNCAKGSLREGLEEGKSLRSEGTIPVLFRIHHCVGDGVALLRLLLESIADGRDGKIDGKGLSEEGEKKMSIPRLRENSTVLGIVTREQEILYNGKHLLAASMPFTTKVPFRKIAVSLAKYVNAGSKILNDRIVEDPLVEIRNILQYCWAIFQNESFERAKKTVENASRILYTIISGPNCLLQQALRSLDKSVLHGADLRGEKLLSLWMENHEDRPHGPNLMTKIRDIKEATGCRFGDVVLAALSHNLHRYFTKMNEPPPKALTVVIPARMTVPSKRLSLQNDFSVGLLTLCCDEINGESGSRNETREEALFERLIDVSRSSEKLRKDSDYAINFWVMRWLAALLPERLLRPVLESHSTLVFSNLPGPQEVSIVGHRLKNVAFWIPHRGRTGLGCSFLTYGGKAHFSISADTALVPSQALLDEIVRNTVTDIEKLHDSISLSCLAIRI